MDKALDAYYSLALDDCERNQILEKQHIYSNDVLSQYELDDVEKLICWISGISAGAVDAFLVTDVRKLGINNILKIKTDHLDKSGAVNSWVDKKIKNLFSPKKVRELESRFKVPYDAASNIGLKEYVLGLNPKTHRLQSFGHDPILGFYYGIRDILYGQFTAVDNAGKIIRQDVTNFDKTGINFFKAVAIQLGHLRSDISTQAGLPIPFMSHLMLLEGGNIKGFTYNRLLKNMYAKGYNFNQLLSMSVPAMLIEVSVRLLYFIFSISKGVSFFNSLPINKPKLDRMLFNAYLISIGCNSIKITITNGNIFAFNPTLWLSTMRYGIFEMKKSMTNEKERKRHEYVIDIYKKNIKLLEESIEREMKFYID